MRVEVIYGENVREITNDTNKWLAANEDKVVITSISPAIPKSSGGGYITIIYTEMEKLFTPVEESRHQ